MKLRRWFSNDPLRADQVAQISMIRDLGREFAQVILDNTPSSPDQSAAIRHIRDAVADATGAIVSGGA